MRPLPGAQVSIPGTGRGSLTNASGEFILVGVPAGAHTVRVQMIGFETAEENVTVSADQTVQLNFSLRESAVALDEIVVTAAGESRAREIGTSMAAISSQQIENAPVANAQEILQGRAPGVSILGNSGQPGSGGTIRLRGNNSISQGNDPIIYVDGVRIYGGSSPTSLLGRQGSLPLNDIRAEDIERVEIVKGAAATTLYGTEASGGVIQIFTKRGIQGAPMWSAEVSAGINNMGHLGPSEDPTGMYMNQCRGPDLYALDIQTSSSSLGENIILEDPTCPSSGTWFRNGPTQRYGVSVRGGGDQMTYFLSGNYGNEKGVIATSGSEDLGFRGNFSFRPVDQVDVALTASYTRRSTQWVADGNSASGLLLNVTRGPNSNFRGTGCTNPDAVCLGNGESLDTENTNGSDHFITGLTINYDPTEAFSNRFTVGYDYNAAIIESLSPFGFSRIPLGQLHSNSWNRTLVSLDYAGSFQNSFGSDFASTFSFGGQLFEDSRRTLVLVGNDFAGPGRPTLESAARRDTNTDERLRVVNAGIFLQEMIGWKDRLFITAGLRVDGNSSFGRDFGLQPYPKLSASYVISDHDFWPSTWFEAMKLRAAVGESGKAPGAFDAVRTWDPIAGNDGQPAFTPNQLGNPTLGPERTREVEFGFDASAFEGRLGLEFTYFRQNTTDALIQVRYPPTEGFLNRQLENVGHLRNTGVEVRLDGGLVRTANLDWRARLNVSTVDSEAIDLNGEEILIGLRNYAIEGYPVPSYFGRRIVNANEIADPIIEENAYLGSSYPTHTIGIGSTLTLMENLTLDVLGEYSGGAVLANWTGYQNATRGTFRPCHDVQRKLIAAMQGDASALNDVTALERGRCAIDRTQQEADFWVQSSDFFKLRTLSATYQIPTRLIPGSRSASFTLAGRNLFTITDYNGIDPEVADQRDGQFARREYYNLPPMRSFEASLRVGF